MRALLLLGALLCFNFAQADTINNFMSISNNIPQMEMKADPQSQAWARSARNVIAMTGETVAETLIQANETARAEGKPFFCLPIGTFLDADTMTNLIVQTYKEISSQQSDKDKMTVSQVAWLGVTKKYPCQTTNNSAQVSQMQHIDALLKR